MEREALQLIIDQALEAAAKELDLDSARVVVLPEGAKLESLEKFQTFRNRFKGHMFTRSLHDFAAYLRQHAEEYSEHEWPPIFVDQGNMAASVFFDFGNRELPGHCDDSATLSLTPTAPYARMLDVVNKHMTQANLLEYLEDWAPALLAHANDSPITMGAAINAIRRITVNELRKTEVTLKPFYSSESTLDEVETSSAEVMPTAFSMMITPYDGLPLEEIKLSLSANVGPNGLFFKLRWQGEEAQREEIAKGFKLSLSDALGEAAPFPLIIGSFRKSE